MSDHEREHFDVVIVGAGISGVASAYHLSTQCPDRSFVVLDEQPAHGGTWRTHRYPGARSDSDLHTFGYRFKPWVGPPIATAGEILAYMDAVIAETGLEPHIRYGCRVVSAAWSSADDLWTLEVARASDGAVRTITTGFLWMCQGYYRQSEGYTPSWPDMDRFKGRIVHPQTWPADLDYKDKQVAVIGSGATAATLVPAIAPDCAHVTLVQRSPSYFIYGRNRNEMAETLRSLDIDESWIHEIARRKILADQAAFIRRAFEEPETVRDQLLAGVAAFLPPDEVERNFTPRYLPWRQRIAFVPDGDIFKVIASGKASVVTAEIEGFTPGGVHLANGQDVAADIVITATGFELNVLGDIDFIIDGRPLVFSDTVTYRGMMFTGVPNLVWVFGYFRASWTLRSELVADFVCRLLNGMKARGASRVEVALRPQDRDMALSGWVDPENFNPGYLARAMHLLPKRGDKPEWTHTQDYNQDKDAFPAIDLDGAEFVYRSASAKPSARLAGSPGR